MRTLIGLWLHRTLRGFYMDHTVDFRIYRVVLNGPFRVNTYHTMSSYLHVYNAFVFAFTAIRAVKESIRA